MAFCCLSAENDREGKQEFFSPSRQIGFRFIVFAKFKVGGSSEFGKMIPAPEESLFCAIKHFHIFLLNLSTTANNMSSLVSVPCIEAEQG